MASDDDIARDLIDDLHCCVERLLYACRNDVSNIENYRDEWKRIYQTSFEVDDVDGLQEIVKSGRAFIRRLRNEAGIRREN